MSHSHTPAAGPHLCPSTPAEQASVFLGMVTPARRVAYVTPQVSASRELVASLPSPGGLPLEAQYRFAGPCQEAACGYWRACGCALGAQLANRQREVVADVKSADLPACSIRSQCRWFAEQGRAACVVCSYVVTDSREPGNSDASSREHTPSAEGRP